MLVSTHYMDEAERCHRLAYIAYGQLMAIGTPKELVQQSDFVNWRIEGEGIQALAAQLQNQAGVDRVTCFGNALHVSGNDAVTLQQTLGRYCQADLQHWEQSEPVLEDVFIHLMAKAQDNYT